MFTSERLRELAKQHRANAQRCQEQNLRSEYLKLATAYEALADTEDRPRLKTAVVADAVE
jgi:hypothetical protein